MKKTLICTAVAMVLLFGIAGVANANLLSNAGFETGDLTGWTIGGSNGGYGVLSDGQPITGVEAIFFPSYQNVRSGDYAAFAVTATRNNEYVSFAQTLSLAAGDHTASFYMGHDQRNVFGIERAITNGRLGIWINGSLLTFNSTYGNRFSYGSSPSDFTLFDADFTSLGGLTTIEFRISGSGTARAGISIDDFALVGSSLPPVADADGPYIIYVGDTLTLDASGSTDADNDIVSYMWDLEDDGIFETDAGGQAIFDVNYTSLQSLGLIVDHTYNIHVKVTDSKGQSSVADTTLTIVPKPATLVAVDIKPGSCPNPVNVKSKSVLPIAILGTEDVNVITIDPTSVRLAGVAPLRRGYEDVSAPVSDSNDCNCVEVGPDGFLDLTLKFKTQEIVEAIGDVNDGDVLELPLTGVLSDGSPIEGADCILIRGRHKPISPADINKDGVVNGADFAIFAQNWLQSSILDE